jgi:hypothetical protein
MTTRSDARLRGAILDVTTPTKDLQREALTYITSALLETGKAPTMAQIRDRLGLKSRNSAHTIVLALEAAGEIVVTRFAITLPGTGPATYEEGLSDGRAQVRGSLDLGIDEIDWARHVLDKARAYASSGDSDAQTDLLRAATEKST